MVKALVFISAILVFTYSFCEGLECYHCYSDSTPGTRDSQLVRCNEQNLPASNTWVCPDQKSKCIYEVLESEYTKSRQIWRTCSDPRYEPCDPKSVPSGLKMIECSYCGTDKCNLHGNKTENTFTINIDANVNLFIKQ